MNSTIVETNMGLLASHRACLAVLTVVRGAALSVHFAGKSLLTGPICAPPLKPFISTEHALFCGTWWRIGGGDPGAPACDVIRDASAPVLVDQSATILHLNFRRLTRLRGTAPARARLRFNTPRYWGAFLAERQSTAASLISIAVVVNVNGSAEICSEPTGLGRS